MLFRSLNQKNLSIRESPVTAENLARLVALIADETISGKIAKTVFEEMWASGKEPALIVKEKGLVQVSDPTAIEAAVRKVLESNPKQLAEYRAGKEKLFGFFVGQTMKETQGKANPALLNELVLAFLKGEKS